MLLSILLCLLAFVLTVRLLRNGKPSLGLPAVYLYLLLLIHVPGAVAHVVPDVRLPWKSFTETGIRYTAFGSLAFVGGLWLARLGGKRPFRAFIHPGRRFLLFCLMGGWLVTFLIRPFVVRIPSLGAAVDNGARIWVLAVIFGVGFCFLRRNWTGFLVWAAVMLLYPVAGLLGSGFLSYGSTTTILSCGFLVIAVEKTWRLWAGVLVISIAGMGLFVSYFTIRDDIRDAVWGGAKMEERFEESGRILREFEGFDLNDREHLEAVNVRLNQNVFVGMAASRLERGIVDYYGGRTIWEGLLSLIPRALWAGKPVYGGSPDIINEMTDFVVNEKTTSFGVGNVMEFYINFGLPSLIGGFVLLGLVLGKLDRGAASAFLDRNYARLIVLTLPAFAIIRPGESTVEMVGGGVAALVAGIGWAWLWRSVGGMRERTVARPNDAPGSPSFTSLKSGSPYPASPRAASTPPPERPPRAKATDLVDRPSRDDFPF